MPTPAPLQHNVVATTSSGGTPNTVSAAFGSNNSAGSLLIAGIGINLAAASISGITDSQGNSWSKAVATTSTALDGEVWYAPNSKAGANTLTITITGTTGARVTTVDLVEVSNIVLSSPLDATSSNQAPSGSPICSQAGPTIAAGEFLFGFVARAALVGPTAGPNDSFSSPAVTWNALDEVHSQNPAVISAYGVQTGTGSFAVKWTTASASFVALEASFLATVVAAVPGKRYSRQRQKAPVVRKRPINRVVHEEPSLGSFVLFAPVKRAKSVRKPVLSAMRVKARAVRRRVGAGAAAVVLFAGVRRPGRVRIARPERPRSHHALRFKGIVFNLLTFFFVVPRRSRKLPQRYILHAVPPRGGASFTRRRLSLALATLMLFVRVPARRSAGAIARRSHIVRDRIRHLRRIIGGAIRPPFVIRPVVIHAPIKAVVEFSAEVTAVCVIEARVYAVAEFCAPVRR